MGRVFIMPETPTNPLSLMGKAAGIAYDSDIEDQEKNRKRGINCVKSGHGRMLEFCDVIMKLDGYSCRVIREFARHVGDGLTMVQRSTRYCNENGFDYYTPMNVVRDQESKDNYEVAMEDINYYYKSLLGQGVSKEDAANVLPLGMNTILVVKKNARNLADMSRVRLCTRALPEFRQLMLDIIHALEDYSSEWKQLVPQIFMPKCVANGWCDESQSCGRRPKKDEVFNVLSEHYGKDWNINYLD